MFRHVAVTRFFACEPDGLTAQRAVRLYTGSSSAEDRQRGVRLSVGNKSGAIFPPLQLSSVSFRLAKSVVIKMRGLSNNMFSALGAHVRGFALCPAPGPRFQQIRRAAGMCDDNLTLQRRVEYREFTFSSRNTFEGLQ